MSENFQCRFCSASYKEVLGFLDHFESHMNQNDKTLRGQENIIVKNKELAKGQCPAPRAGDRGDLRKKL